MKIISYLTYLYGNVFNKVVFVVILTIISSYSVYAQAQSVRFSQSKMAIAKAFVEIEEQTALSVAYNSQIIDPKMVVSTNTTSRPLSEALVELLKGTSATFKIQEKQILIVEKQVKQEKIRYSGIIKDAANEAIIGASVAIKGTNTGVSSGIDGRFSIEAPQGSYLTVSYVGYITKTILLDSKTELSVILADDNRQLDEVVVIGYGVQNRRDVSTSISTVKGDQLAGVPVSDFRLALAGKMPGVQVMQSSGDPEGSASIFVRGVSTINAGSEPLYIIDGVPMSRGFSNINPNDIESVEVLKDASSAAIYGSRGSNGVILITTKSGKNEKMQVQYDGYYGWQEVSKMLPMMNAYQFAQIAKDAHDAAYLDKNPNGSVNDPNGIRPNSWERIPAELYPYIAGEEGLTDTDWQKAIFRVAPTTSHNISLAGKSKTVNYYVSANYFKRDGIIIGSDFEKYSARLNMDGKYKNFKFGANFSPSYSTSNRVDAGGYNGVVQSALMMPPTFPVYNSDGTFSYQGNGYWRLGNDYQHNAVLNPVAMALLSSDVINRIALTGRVFAEYEFFKGFSYNISVGGDFYGTHNNRYRSSELPLWGHTYYDRPSNPIGQSASAFYFNWLIENKINYNTTINKYHSINAMLVQSAQKETYEGNSVKATDYPNDYVQTIGGGTVFDGSSNKTQWAIASYLARVQYSYKGRYMFSAAARTDGSSRFGKSNRWGFFPSVSGAWRISDENFFRNAPKLSFVDDIKLRISWGVTGNFNIGNYDHLATMTNDNYIFGTGAGDLINGSLVNGYKPDKVKNDELRWEKNSMSNVGVDIKMLGGYFGATVDYYNTNTSDMLLTVPVPLVAGYSTTLMNIGKVNNRGWEVALTSEHSYMGGFAYSINLNYARNKNEVKALGPKNTPFIKSGSVDHAYYITQVGSPIGCYYVLVQDGVFPTEESLKEYPHFSTTRPGDFRFVDVDGDGELDIDKDRTIVGNYMPKFTYGIGGSLRYKSVDMGFGFQGVYGNKILNLNRRYIDNMEGNTNQTTLGVDRWRSESERGNGRVNRANRKQSGYNGRTSTWHIEDGSYFRLQNLSMGYTLPAKFSSKIYVSKLRIYVMGENLWTSTNYSGYNPEVSNRNNSETPGEDYGTYPLSRVVTVGLNITF